MLLGFCRAPLKPPCRAIRWSFRLPTQREVIIK